jgi:hypothetical protein
VKSLHTTHEGLVAAGGARQFEGTLHPVPPQMILTDLPRRPRLSRRTQARRTPLWPAWAARILGDSTVPPDSGSVTFLGFRPRDDQAASLGYEVRTWFEILSALGAYPSSRRPADDPPAIVSRRSPWLATRFPNGTVALAAHYRSHVESWPGGFHRNIEQDDEILKYNPPPPDSLEIDPLTVSGRTLRFRGSRVVAFREDATGRLAAFAGYQTDRIRVDDREHVFSDKPMEFIAWAPVPPARRMPGGARLEVWVQGAARIRIPWNQTEGTPRLVRAGNIPGTSGPATEATFRDGWLEFEAGPGKAQGHLYLLES